MPARSRKEFHKPVCQPKRPVVDGIKVHSAHEAKVYGELKLLERAGKIKNLQRQISYKLIVNGVKVCTYVADFTYTDATKDGEQFVMLDAKQFLTPVYRIKKALMLALYGITIVER